MKKPNWKFLIPSVSTVVLSCLLLFTSFLLIGEESYSTTDLSAGEFDDTDSEYNNIYGFGPCIVVNTNFDNEDGSNND